MAYENNEYCNWDAQTAKVVAGKDLLLCVFDNTGTDLLAIAGQQGLAINRSADSIDITSKDSKGGYKSKIAGMKEWSIDTDGVYNRGDNSHKVLTEAFEKANPVCIKVFDAKTGKSMFGGLAAITDYSLEAGHEDAMTYSISLEGMGKLVDLQESTTATQKPVGYGA